MFFFCSLLFRLFVFLSALSIVSLFSSANTPRVTSRGDGWYWRRGGGGGCEASRVAALEYGHPFPHRKPSLRSLIGKEHKHRHKTAHKSMRQQLPSRAGPRPPTVCVLHEGKKGKRTKTYQVFAIPQQQHSLSSTVLLARGPRCDGRAGVPERQ